MAAARPATVEVSHDGSTVTGLKGLPKIHRSNEAWVARSALLTFKDRLAMKPIAQLSSWRVRFSSRRLTPMSASARCSDASVAAQSAFDLLRFSYRYQQAVVSY